LYRDALDYQSTAVMQFNVAATYRQLGDANNALSALETAVAMDRQYGLRQDAEDNAGLLLPTLRFCVPIARARCNLTEKFSAYRINLDPLYFAGAGNSGARHRLAMVIVHAVHVTKANPVHALRYE
jgi:hypothetical protein